MYDIDSDHLTTILSDDDDNGKKKDGSLKRKEGKREGDKKSRKKFK